MPRKKSAAGLFISVTLLLLMGAGGYFLLLRQTRSEYGRSSSERTASAQMPANPGREEKNDAPAYNPSLKIRGSERFRERVKKSLKLIWLFDRKKFRLLRKLVFEIRESDTTGFTIREQTPTILISDRNAFRSVTWCAGIIAHQTFHAYASYLKKRREGGRIPPPPGQKPDYEIKNLINFDYISLDTLIKIEEKAVNYQLNLMKKINAPKNEIRLLEKRKPRDFALNHDGKYSLAP